MSDWHNKPPGSRSSSSVILDTSAICERKRCKWIILWHLCSKDRLSQHWVTGGFGGAERSNRTPVETTEESVTTCTCAGSVLHMRRGQKLASVRLMFGCLRKRGLRVHLQTGYEWRTMTLLTQTCHWQILSGNPLHHLRGSILFLLQHLGIAREGRGARKKPLLSVQNHTSLLNCKRLFFGHR